MVLAAMLGGLVLPHVSLAAAAAVARPEGREIFSCTFQKELAKPWRIVGGKWEVREECLQQLDAGLDDPNKAVLVLGDAEDLSSGIIVTAKLRLDAWKDSDWARAGVGCCCDPASGHGLNLVFNRRTAPVRPRLRGLGTGLCLSLSDRHDGTG